MFLIAGDCDTADTATTRTASYQVRYSESDPSASSAGPATNLYDDSVAKPDSCQALVPPVMLRTFR